MSERWRAVMRTAAIGFLIAAGFLAAPAPEALAHAFLESSEPAANAVAATAPATVTMRFTEPLEASYSRAELLDQTGAPVTGASGQVATDPRTMVLTPPADLATGTYAVLWRTLSTADGHTSQGYFPFTVGTRADVREVAPASQECLSALLPDWVYAGARWLALLGLAAVLAIWPVWVFVVRYAISPAWQLGPRLLRRARAYTVAAVVFSLIANVIALLVQAMAVAGPTEVFAGLALVLRETRYGTWWLVRVGLVLLFAAALLGAGW